MDVRCYGTGPITADAAFTSDFAIPDDIPTQNLVNMVEIERRSMDVRPGMRHKYMPLRFDPATGARQVGGRYLFDTWKNAVEYNTFTSKELEFEPGVKFWDRPFFLGVDRHIWRVTGLMTSRRWPPRTTPTALNAGRTPAITWSGSWNRCGRLSFRTPDGRAWPVRTGSVGRFLPAELGVEKVFDRSSLILAMWLPRSRLAGGAPSAYPAAPVHPLPQA
jgi:hypothetical protein